MTKAKRMHCFYCFAPLAKRFEYDHFPIPKNCGGKETVPVCLSCHDMKDRVLLENWPAEWMLKVAYDFPKLSRETRLFLAKSIRIVMEAKQQLEETKKKSSAS